MTLAAYLTKRSAEICKDNHCTEDEHNCESYAYINADYELLDLCGSDFFQGSSRPYAAVSMPWTGTQQELEEEVDNQIIEQEV